ncbi:MAG: FliG C-terminal domain-containing protein [Aureliella sp.]
MAGGDGVQTQVRRIAILVTSLDAAAGRQLLSAMPNPLAREVRKAMAGLTAIDPEERRRVLADFHNQARSATSTSAPSALAPSAAAANEPRRPAAGLDAAAATPPISETRGAGLPERESQASAGQWADDQQAGANSASAEIAGDDSAAEGGRNWQRFDVPTLTELLRGERATVVAVVLSQLPPQKAVGLLEQFPRQLHRAIIESLSRLGEIDPEAMQAIDEHLASRIADYGHRRASESESLARMNSLLAAASPELRGHWQEIIAQTDQQLADRLGIAAPPQPVTARAPVTERASVTTKSSATATTAEQPRMPEVAGAAPSLVELLGSGVVTTADNAWHRGNASQTPAAGAGSGEHETSDAPHVLPFPGAARPGTTDRQRTAHGRREPEAHVGAITQLEQILELPTPDIAQVLSAADGEVILLALAGASPAFMNRFLPLLERADARALQAQLRRLDAINLQDIDEAQRRLCELASQFVRQSESPRGRPAVQVAA